MTFTKQEIELLKDLIVEEAQRMDDDGNDGAFDASPLKPIYEKLRIALEQ
tara:strand:- start:4106 stop:4255 length:150 start_codon:yes stop_codon:yes gene_type:complete